MPGVVTKHLFDLIAKQVEDQKLVVWYDPECPYTDAVASFDLSDARNHCWRSGLSGPHL